MKKLNAMGFVIFVLAVTQAHAKLVEDGSSFTGLYHAQEKECYFRKFDPYVPNQDLSEVSVKGASDGLTIESFFLELPEKTFNLPDGFFHSTKSAYVSDRIFTHDDTFAFGAERSVSHLEYQLDASNNLISTGTGEQNGKIQPTVTCHFNRAN